MRIILFPSNFGMETNCRFTAALLRVQSVLLPSQCETKPLQTFDCYMNQNAASAQGGTSREQVWWSARETGSQFYSI